MSPSWRDVSRNHRRDRSVQPGPKNRAEERQPLLVLEAMKMETPLNAPYDATVRSVNVAEGDSVQGGALLVELED